MPRLLLPIVVLLLLRSEVSANETLLTYEEHIRPIFRAHCFDCHGATEDVEGGLDLRQVRFLTKGGESGPAIVPGVPSESFLLERVKNGEMPPGQHVVPEAQIQVIEQWIAEGAKTRRPEPESIPPGLGLTPEERSFWSFQPIRRPDIPGIESYPSEARVRTPVDALIVSSFPSDSRFSPDADRETLVRRVYFDLTGLPPSPEELATWANDESENWYDRLINELLDSPHYGERWARHWLDVGGYADSEGDANSDVERPWAWRYRDWVIRSFNDDKPFDRFIIEQLAGDELAGPKNGEFTPEQIELLTATGFLRTAADGTATANDEATRNKVMADTLKILSTSLLGLSVQCAQCHDHRYDPIPQTDYYALRAVFEPALDWKAWQTPDGRRVSLYTAKDRERAAAIESETKVVADERAVKLAEYMKQALDTELMKFEEPLRAQLRVACETPVDMKTEEHKALLERHPSLNINPGNLYQYIAESQAALEKYDKQINEIRARKPVEQFVRALVEPANHIPETKLFYRGDHEQPKQVVMPAGLTVVAPEDQPVTFPVDDETVPSSGRRLAFAKWLTSGQNPLVARVIVNRVWLHHFGKGLVETPADLGQLGARPSHPELLDWLAVDFMRQGWSLKALHRVILKSTVWRQSSERTGLPSSVPFARRRLMRLDAETIRDRMLAASGQLDRSQFGPPIAIKADDTGQIVVDGSQTRRSVYIKSRRSQPVAMMQAFDAPVMQTNCEVRQNSTVATQSLMLMNGEFILGQAEKLAERAAGEAVPLSTAALDGLPELPRAASEWQYGFGAFDPERNHVVEFAGLPHWTGSQWQGGPELPDAKLGWVLLNADGGHPDAAGRATIRRWTASSGGTVSITGTLSHGSPNGNGVRGRVVASGTGRAGEWVAFNGSSATEVASIAVAAGDHIDFVTDANGDHTSDSFSWPVTITWKRENHPDQQIASAATFRGPSESPELIAGQIVRAWELALCRRPTVDELKLATHFAALHISTLNRNGTQLPAGRTPERQAIVSLCQSLFSSNEFLYVE